jgi:hypothetical protein
MRDEVEDRSVVSHDEANGRYELWGSMKPDELGDMGRLVPMWYEVYYEHMSHFLKISYRYKAILNLQS